MTSGSEKPVLQEGFTRFITPQRLETNESKSSQSSYSRGANEVRKGLQYWRQAPSAPPGRPGKFHPEPLTDPCLTVSHHSRAAALHRNRRAPPVSSWPIMVPARMTHPLRSTDITPLLHYYEVVRPLVSPPYFRPRGSNHL